MSITAGYAHTCALDTTGKAWCWGFDGPGELGDGDTDQTSKYSPVAVTGGRTCTTIKEDVNLFETDFDVS